MSDANAASISLSGTSIKADKTSGKRKDKQKDKQKDKRKRKEKRKSKRKDNRKAISEGKCKGKREKFLSLKRDKADSGSEIERYDKYFDAPFGVDEYQTGEKRFNRGPAWVIVGTVAGLCKVLYRYDVKGFQSLDTLARHGGVVVVSNHTSYLDVVFMYLSMFPRYWPRFMARDSLFESSGFLRWVFAHIGAFPVKRDSADRQAIKRAARMLKNGEIVGIMPEGSRRGKGSVTPSVHGGAGLVARMGKAPILPMAVHNVGEVKRKGERLRFPKITVEYGNPVLLSDFDFLPKEDRLNACVWYALRECFALIQHTEPEKVDMAALFPGDKDFTREFEEHPIPRLTSQQVVELLS